MTNPDHTHVDWAQRYREDNTPWDRGHAHAELQRRIASGQLAPPREGARCYVPGCGKGHDALALAEAGWRVTAKDIVEELAPELGAALEALGSHFVAGDAFECEGGPFDLVWEHTFYCAIRLEERARWGAMARAAVAPGGHLAALVFPADKPRDAGGPPWGWDANEMAERLAPEFELVETEALDAGVEGREWAQAFALFRRT